MRADLMIAGCAILEAICRSWKVGKLRVADRGVREGILFGLIETFSTVFLSSAYKDGIGMILLIAILLVLPSGLVGLWQKRS